MTDGGIAMHVNDKCHHTKWLDLIYLKRDSLNQKFSEVTINKKYKILSSEICRVPKTSEKEFLEICAHKMRFVNSLNVKF